MRGDENSRRIYWQRTLLQKKNAPLQRAHLRFHPQQARAGILHCFLIDCSGSMLSGQRLGRAKGLLLQLLQLAYQQRAQIAIISFAGANAVTRVFPTAARPLASRAVQDWLQPLDGGGATPFARGVDSASALLAQTAQRDPAQQRWLWLLSDGRSRELPPAPQHADRRIVIDCEQQRVALGRCQIIAQQWQAEYRTLNGMVCDDFIN